MTCPDDEILCYGCFIKCIYGHRSRIIWSKTNLLNNQYAVLYKIMWYNAVYMKNIFWQIPSYVHLRIWLYESFYHLPSFPSVTAGHSFRFHVPGEHLSIMQSEPSYRRLSSKLQHWASCSNLCMDTGQSAVLLYRFIAMILSSIICIALMFLSVSKG